MAHVGIGAVDSFHMTLSHSRDPFTCFTTSMDLATFWDCHRRAFAHFGGVPGSIFYDRTKTAIKRHVAPGVAVPLHTEASAFAEHYGFTIDVLAGAFTAWLPIRRAQVHRTHGQVISVRAEIDRAALFSLPDQPYLVTDKALRRVGKDALVSFEASFYSVPARQVRAGQRVQLQVDGEIATVRAAGTDGGGWLATHPRARERGSWVVDQAHRDGLPDGHTRAVFVEPTNRPLSPAQLPATSGGLEPLTSLLARRHADIEVAARPLSDYDINNTVRGEAGTAGNR